MTVMVDLVLRSSAVLVAGLAAAAVLRRHSAALRHCVLALTIVGSAAVIPLQFVLPEFAIAVPSRPSSTTAVATVASAHVRIAAPETPERVPLNPARAAAAVWAGGVLASALFLAIGLVRIARIARRSARVADARSLEIMTGIARQRGLRRTVVLLQTGAPDVLATSGVLRPRVLLPAHVDRWSEARLRTVLAHELAHVARHDWFVQIAAEAVRAIFWFNPLIWIACRQLRREAEHACDDVVLADGIPAREYAEDLLALTRLSRPNGSRWAASVPMAHASTLERRITAMLNPRLDRTALSRRGVAATAALLLAIAMPIAAVRAAQSGPATLTGTIYDPTGAVMPGVDVTLEGANEVKVKATSNAQGRFDFAGVQPGGYVLSAAIPGFRTLRQEFELRASRDWDRAITLQVGDLRETISIRGTRLAAPAAPSTPRGPEPVRVGGNIRVPKKTLDVKPVYPATMRAAGREGVVPIEAIIGREGAVTSVRVLSAQVHPDFAIAAVDAVRQWQFTPTLLNGSPVEVVMNVSVSFSLDDSK